MSSHPVDRIARGIPASNDRKTFMMHPNRLPLVMKNERSIIHFVKPRRIVFFTRVGPLQLVTVSPFIKFFPAPFTVRNRFEKFAGGTNPVPNFDPRFRIWFTEE